ncbi:hypothetical protein [Paenibacillus glycanilyticus]|nr:hypothetical protein [Paenibacillus glycanilyticus]
MTKDMISFPISAQREKPRLKASSVKDRDYRFAAVTWNPQLRLYT